MEYLIEKERTLPVSDRCDVLVAGGGIAGISAALSAARGGANVILLEREYLLGGLATLGLITIYLPICDGMGRQVAFGNAEELLRLAVKNGVERDFDHKGMAVWLDGEGDAADREKYRFEAQYNPHLFATEAEQLLTSLGVIILYGTYAVATEANNGKITHVIIENKSGRSAVAVKSVVDTTGDADICCYSEVGTEPFECKNRLANWYYYVSGGSVDLRIRGPVDDPSNPNREVHISDLRFSGVDAAETSEMMMLARADMLRDVAENRATDPSFTPVCLPTIPQLRTTRHIVGEYAQGIEEMHKHFDSSIGMIGDWRKRGPVYELPFETLYSKKVKNLITAGRCISSKGEMIEVMRVIPTCAVTGQAAGTAAAMTDDFSSLDVAALQAKLTADGVVLHESDL